MRSKEQSQISSLIGTRDKFVKLRTSLKNKIHNILNANGIVSRPEMFSGQKGLRKVLGMDLDESYRFEVGLIVEQIIQLNEAIEKINENC